MPTGAWDGSTANFTTDVTGGSQRDDGHHRLRKTTSASRRHRRRDGAYTVTVSGTQSAHAVKVALGNVTLTGGTIATPMFDVAGGAAATVASNVAGGPAGSRH